MVIGLLLVQLALCLVILRREVVLLRFRHFASSLFFVAYTILFVLEPLVLHLFFGGATSIVAGSTEKFADVSVYYLYNAYGIGLLVVYLLGSRPSREADQPEPVIEAPVRDGQRQATFAAVLIIGGFIMFVQSTGMSLTELLYASRFAWFGESTFSVFWLTVSSYFLALAAIFAYHIRASGSRWHWLTLLCLAAIVLNGIMTKDRKWIIFLVSGWIAGTYDKSGRSLTLRRNGVLAMGTLFGILLISQFLRDVLVRAALGQQIVLASEISRWSSFLIEYGDISYFYRASLEAIHQNLNNDFIVWFALPRRILLFFVPTGLSAGLKVEDISAIFSDVVDGGDAIRRGNMPPGLFGLFVISFGWFASLFIIPLLALLIRKLDRVFSMSHGTFRASVLALYFFSVVLALRGDDSSAVYFVLSTFLLMAGWKALFRPASSPPPVLDAPIRPPDLPP